ncbi:MAG: sugar phosphate isomerase/epimerase [Thermoguttaceae bacterium]|nr:sugar phosphate isomerase/epimerase [Thermoguttaceae bacterium]
MMRANRRAFIAGTTAAAFGLAASRTFGVELPAPKQAAVLKLSSQLGVIPGDSLEAKLAKMKKWGFEGVELGGDIVGNEKKYRDAVANAGLKVSAICWGSCEGKLVSEDESKRKEGVDALKQVLESAGQLESTGVIYVPAFNGQTKLTNQEIRKVLLDTFPAIGEYAVSVKSRVLFEPLNRGEAYFLRQVADGAAICRDINSPGVQLMGDFYHMYIEETSDMAAFLAAGDYLHHVHLASRIRVLPGQDERQFVDGFRGLKLIGFQDYCSFECGVKGDREVEIPKSMAFLRDQWQKA